MNAKKLLAFGTLAALLGSFHLTASDTDARKKDYPVDTCVVSDEKLGEMGPPYQTVAKTSKGDRLFLLCCKGCVKKLNKEPDAYAKKLDEAAASKK